MTAVTPVDRIAAMLSDAGYRRLETPLEIAGLSFDVPVAFVGMSPSPDLVLVADTAFDDERRLLSKLEGIARALDVMRSKRPMTAVLAGPRPSSLVLEAMSRVCRVLPVGTVLDSDADANLRNWLAILMPLHLPESTASIADPLAEIAGQVDGILSEVASLIDLAPQGASVVRARLLEIIDEPLQDLDLDENAP